MNRFRDIVAPYGLFFVDQFGVLRDGDGPYPEAVDSLVKLRDEGRRVVILSNSGKRSAINEERLVRMGFPRSSFDHFLTSGEVVWRLLADGTIKRPRTCLVLSRNGDTSPVDGLGITLTDDPAEAEMVLIAGSEIPDRSFEEYRAILAPCAARKVPAICANPDMIMLISSGKAPGSGQIARLYERLGGTVTWLGKPHPTIYWMARALTGLTEAKALGVGDSIEHDIAGAKGVGADAALILAGIHAGASDLEAEYAEYGARPDYVLDRFVW
ncbi:MAG: TIGR01459 family HAD-type hydrolase [Labrys sp. (in: a-proteobacteria)]|jgi:HAD superfamily hydrolase (TIGR01459 family)